MKGKKSGGGGREVVEKIKFKNYVLVSSCHVPRITYVSL
jgi:hypothetical protein